MSTRNNERQWPLSACADLGIANIGTGNGIVIKIPIGALLMGIDSRVLEAFDSGTTTTLTVSDGTNTFVNAIDAQASDAYEDVVISGLLSPTSGTLASTMTAGSAYVGEVLVTKTATAHTYTTLTDTYVDLSPDGTLTYVEVANGAGVPAVTATALRLQKVVAAASTITAVTRLASVHRSGTATGASVFYPNGGTLTVSMAETGDPATVGRAVVTPLFVTLGCSNELCVN